MRALLTWFIGGTAIVVGSFFGTLPLIDYLYPNYLRVAQITTVKDALERYRTARGKYPNYPGNPLTDLKPDLTGFISTIPKDPVFGTSGTEQYYYASDGQQKYAILVHLNNPATASTNACLTGVNFADAGWWPGAPPCAF